MPRFFTVIIYLCLACSSAFAYIEANLFQAILKNDLAMFKTNLALTKQREGIINPLGHTLLYTAAEHARREIIELLLEAGFSVNETNQAPTHLSPRSHFTASLPIKTPSKKSLTPRKRSSSTYLVRHLPTPIFALVKKNAQPIDLEIARMMLNAGAELYVKDSNNKTAIDRLIDFLYRLSQENPVAESNNHDVIKSKKLFLHIIGNQELQNRFIQYWHLFNDTYTTAQLLYQCREQSACIELLKPRIIAWELDNKLPAPEIALDTYQKSQQLLSDKEKFLMLMNYIVRYNHDRIMNIQNTPSSQNNNIIYNHEQIAEMIFFIHKQYFLQLTPDEIMMRFCLKKKEGKIENFLARTERLQRFIAHLIVTSKKPLESAKFWKKVGLRLLELGDLFGVHAVYGGINSPSVGRIITSSQLTKLLKELPEINHYHTYVNIKKEKQGNVIPALVIDSGRLINIIESTDTEILLGESDASLHANYMVFANELKNAQEWFQQERYKLKYELDQDLYNTIHYLFSSGADELISLHYKYDGVPLAPQEELRPEYWCTTDFYWWLRKYVLNNTLTITDLINLGITHPKELIERYVMFLANNHDTIDPHEKTLMNIFEDYCNLMKRPLLMPPELPFEDELTKYPEARFSWIMWLRNNGIQDDIPVLFNNGIDTFATFCHRMKRKEKLVYSSMTVEKLENLYHNHELSRNLPDSLIKWNFSHLEAWLLSRSLHHFLPAIAKDCKQGMHRFFAFGYFLHVYPNQFILLPNTNNWIFKVFEELKKEYYLEEIITDFIDQERLKQRNTNYLFFIKTLKELGIDILLPKFYSCKIMSFSRLSNIWQNNELLNQMGLDDEKKKLLEQFIIRKRTSHSKHSKRISRRIIESLNSSPVND